MCQNQPTSEGGSSVSTLMSGFIHSCVNRQSMFNIYIYIYRYRYIYLSNSTIMNCKPREGGACRSQSASTFIFLIIFHIKFLTHTYNTWITIMIHNYVSTHLYSTTKVDDATTNTLNSCTISA